MHRLRALASLLSLLLAGMASAQQPLDTNLLQNPDFETGVGGWTVTRGSFATKLYGTAIAPTLTVGAAIGGGTQFVECTNAIEPGAGQIRFGVMQQVFDLTGNAAEVDSGGLYVELSGYVGGAAGGNHRSYLRASYRNATGGALSVPFVDPTTSEVNGTHRNNESQLLGVSHVFPIPAMTRSLVVELICYGASSGNGATYAWADNVGVKLRLNPITTPLPLGINLWDAISFDGLGVLNPQTMNGARVARGQFSRRLYGSANAASLATSSAIQGGNQYLECSYGVEDSSWPGYRYGYLYQDFDVTGNANDIDAGRLYVQMSGFFGGAAGTSGFAYMSAAYYNETGGQLSVPFVTPTMPAIWQVSRNNEALLVAGESAFPIPPLTRRLRVNMWAGNAQTSSGATNGWADNLNVKLIDAAGRYTPQLGANLIDNGTFESAAIVHPAAPQGWRVTSGTFQAQPYGLPNLPTPAVASAIGGGSYLARPTAVSSGQAAMQQRFLLHNLATMIDTSQLSVSIDCHLGGVGASADNCYIRAYYYSEYGAQLRVDQVGPVTAGNRSNVTTLLLRQGTFLLPVGTRGLVVEANFAGVNGLLDNLAATLVPSGVALLFPGTGDDLTLGTGINGVPSGGPGRDVKFALANDIVSIQVRSPQGAFHWLPLMVAGTAFSTGSSFPSLGAPSLHVNPFISGGFFLLDGVTQPGPFNRPMVLPTGTDLQLAVPPGLAGYSVRIQALVLTVTAGNGLYAATDAHDLRFL